MNLTDKLLTIKPRETAGARASNRFLFQKNWALCHLLTLHEDKSKNDYVIIFEHHDDIIELDSDTTPLKVKFYQVKTSNKKWTTHSLISIPKNESRSILGKLIENYIIFGEHSDKAILISNATFQFTINSSKSTKSLINLIELDQKEKDVIKDKISNELLSVNRSLSDDSFFEHAMCCITDLSVSDSIGHAKGKVLEFLKQINEKSQLYASAFYDNLFTEISKRTCNECTPNEIADLLTRKGITKKHISGWLNQYLELTSSKSIDWQRIVTRLDFEHFPLPEIKQLNIAFKEYELLSMNFADNMFIDFKKAIKNAVNADSRLQNLPNLRSIIDDGIGIIMSLLEPKFLDIYNFELIKCMLLLELLHEE